MGGGTVCAQRRDGNWRDASGSAKRPLIVNESQHLTITLRATFRNSLKGEVYVRCLMFALLLGTVTTGWGETYHCTFRVEEGSFQEQFLLTREGSEFNYQMTLFGKQQNSSWKINAETHREIRLSNEEMSLLLFVDKQTGSFLGVEIAQPEAQSAQPAYQASLELGEFRMQAP